jgi:hypothetical protein
MRKTGSPRAGASRRLPAAIAALLRLTGGGDEVLLMAPSASVSIVLRIDAHPGSASGEAGAMQDRAHCRHAG